MAQLALELVALELGWTRILNHRLGLNTTSEIDGGQLEGRGNDMEAIYISYDNRRDESAVQIWNIFTSYSECCGEFYFSLMKCVIR